MMIDEGAKHYKTTTLAPRTFTDTEWKSLAIPVRIDIAADKSMAGGQAAAARARTLGKSPVTAWPDTTHSLPMQAAEQLGPELLRYWAAGDR